MPSSTFVRSVMLLAALGAALGLMADTAGAAGGIVGTRGWQRVAYAEGDACEAEVRGNGKIFRIAGAGLRPGEVVQFHLENEDIRSLEYRIVADAAGGWSKFYMPFLWNRSGGTVSVDLESASCSLTLSFGWARQTDGYNSRLTG